MAFRIEFSDRAQSNFKALRKNDQQIIYDAVTEQLTHQPDQPTRHRKKLEDNELAPWELRIGDFRVFYDIDTENSRVILEAIGEKTHGILRVGGKEVQL
jgi:mRNA-degrading endonuclease RelE of RelBE toxin-antitoxin system